MRFERRFDVAVPGSPEKPALLHDLKLSS